MTVRCATADQQFVYQRLLCKSRREVILALILLIAAFNSSFKAGHGLCTVIWIDATRARPFKVKPQ
ncbi:hypothetical protein IV02_06320 [Pseudomonas syringae]|jgi:hypothetical protein|uniref:Uncharacterized protein n=1 Tax=Pseudomonas syringae TaxID=317 RepID=A0A085VCV0_PSESX|nr:hypothetical protein CFII64_14740 [Pseudomonas sp. CFII64]KFE53263.1 hypothetical protein IV02_06320 [Pseudomonas syringae]